jgi:23S rRNA (uridine2552-2'-O)-methyltransferase
MKKGNKWRDHYTRRAKEEKWLARSVYKLEEIDKKYRLIKPGKRVMDLGCYPGSWSQYIIKKVGKRGEVIGIDLNAPEKVTAQNFKYIKGNILDLQIDMLFPESYRIDLLLSDLAPQTTGNNITDCAKSLELAGKALDIAVFLLRKNGHFLCKVFEGEDFRNFQKHVLGYFKEIRLIRPGAVRKRSREIYLLGLKKL